jgi:TRAP-type C4-dicarboxylate transport system permease small subunit
VTLRKIRQGYELALEWIMIVLMIGLAVEVTAGVIFRYSGHSLVWYDEVATILLAWVTFYGSALAVLKNGHMGVPEIVRLMPLGPRVAATIVAQAFIVAFYLVLAWSGYSVMEVLATDHLVSLPKVSVAFVQSVIPISAVLIIVAQVMVFPEALDEALRGDIVKAEELI